MQPEQPSLPWGPPDSGSGEHSAQPAALRGTTDPRSQPAAALCPWFLGLLQQPSLPVGAVPLHCRGVRTGCQPAPTHLRTPAPAHHPRLPAGATRPERRPDEASPAFSRIIQPPGLRRDERHPSHHHTSAQGVRLPSLEAMPWAPLTLPHRRDLPWAEHLLSLQVPPEQPRRVLKVGAPSDNVRI